MGTTASPLPADSGIASGKTASVETLTSGGSGSLTVEGTGSLSSLADALGASDFSSTHAIASTATTPIWARGESFILC
jgi:hypothetical protein